MRIVDFQTGKEIRDVAVSLTEEEMLDLSLYLNRLKSDQRISCAHLTEVSGSHFLSELTVVKA